MQIVYPLENVISDPGQPWDGSSVTDLAVSEVAALGCQDIMDAVDRPEYSSHPVSCSFVTLPDTGSGTVYFMNPDTLAYVGSVEVRTDYPSFLQEDVIYDVFVSLIVANWALDFVLFFAYLRKKVRKISKSS